MNSNSLQIRHTYDRLNPVLAGQTWSTFMLPKMVPESLNFNGPVSEVFVRRGMVRYTHDFGGGTLLEVAVENPETGLIVAPGGLPAAGALGPSNDNLPEFTFRLSHKWSRGHLGLAGLSPAQRRRRRHGGIFGEGGLLGFELRRQVLLQWQTHVGRLRGRRRQKPGPTPHRRAADRDPQQRQLDRRR